MGLRLHYILLSKSASTLDEELYFFGPQFWPLADLQLLKMIAFHLLNSVAALLRCVTSTENNLIYIVDICSGRHPVSNKHPGGWIFPTDNYIVSSITSWEDVLIDIRDHVRSLTGWVQEFQWPLGVCGGPHKLCIMYLVLIVTKSSTPSINNQLT